VSSLELTFWRAFLERVEPISAERRAGVIAATIANANGGKRGGGLFTPDDFFPRLRPPAARQTPDQLRRTFDSIPDFGTKD
jgi:hypothetical protein